MSNRAYTEINLHIVWRVKQNLPILRDSVEHHVYEFIRKGATDANVLVHAIGGTDDHVHIAVGFPAEIPVSEWVGRIKGACSHFINSRILNRKALEWQTGYGVVSFGTKDLPWVIEYIQNQRSNHSSNHVHDRLERSESEAARQRDG